MSGHEPWVLLAPDQEPKLSHDWLLATRHGSSTLPAWGIDPQQEGGPQRRASRSSQGIVRTASKETGGLWEVLWNDDVEYRTGSTLVYRDKFFVLHKAFVEVNSQVIA